MPGRCTWTRPLWYGGDLGDPNNGWRVRCSNLPSVIATEKVPGEDGRIGSMSLCMNYMHKFLEMFGDDHAYFVSTKDEPMDPDANLQEQRELASTILNGDDYVDSGDAVRLAELVQALDGWIKKGGFLPAEWQAARDTKEL